MHSIKPSIRQYKGKSVIYIQWYLVHQSIRMLKRESNCKNSTGLS